jgi:hypothetical protein
MKTLDVWASIYFSPIHSFQLLAKENYSIEALASLITAGVVFGTFLSTCLSHGFFPPVIGASILLFMLVSVFISTFYFLFSKLFGSKASLWKLYQVCSLSCLPFLPMLFLLAPFSWKHMFDITWYGGGILYPLLCLLMGVGWGWILSVLGIREVTGVSALKAFLVTLLSCIAMITILFLGLAAVLMPYLNLFKIFYQML